jgi:hypothetical protein
MDPVRASRLRAIAAAALVALGTTAVVPPGPATAEDSDQQEFSVRLEEAEELRARAAAAGFEWRKTAELLREARQRQQAGDSQQAWQLLDQARTQAELALRQAEHEAEAWRKRVVR